MSHTFKNICKGIISIFHLRLSLTSLFKLSRIDICRAINI